MPPLGLQLGAGAHAGGRRRQLNSNQQTTGLGAGPSDLCRHGSACRRPGGCAPACLRLLEALVAGKRLHLECSMYCTCSAARMPAGHPGNGQGDIFWTGRLAALPCTAGLALMELGAEQA